MIVMTDIIIVGVLLLLLGIAATYLARAKRNGKGCMGCPSCGNCPHSCGDKKGHIKKCIARRKNGKFKNYSSGG